MNKPVVLIVGSGIAGLSAAIEAAQSGARVQIITKALYNQKKYTWQSKGGCSWKTHSFNVAAAPGDSVASHIQDTLEGGALAGNPELVKILCEQAVGVVSWLSGLGVPFEKNGEHVATRPFGGCEVPRAVFFEDRLGFYIMKSFLEKIESLQDSITVHEGLRAQELIKDHHGSLVGVKALKIETLEFVDFFADSIIIADGGGANMYAPTAVSADKTSDGIVMAYRGGAKIIDMEYVQFHPTGISSPIVVFDGSLVEEALRFDGALLFNKYGNRYMPIYSPKGETSTRDEVSRGSFREILNNRAFADHSVILDFSSCRDLIAHKYPALFERLTQAGYDPRKTTTVRVKPVAHFLMGGIMINADTSTNIHGLYASGESAGGIHGANRLGGNGLTEALVFGRISGKSAAAYALGKDKRHKNHSLDPIAISGHFSVPQDGSHTFDSLFNRLRSEMYWQVGPVRTETSLTQMLSTIHEIQMLSESISITTGASACEIVQNFITLKNLLVASELITEAALKRKESRGSHFRDDYPHKDPRYKANGIHLNSANEKHWFHVSYATHRL